MNDMRKDIKRLDGSNSLNNREMFVIAYEAACSPEFSEGCILLEGEEDMD
jgi:hypothetical protein